MHLFQSYKDNAGKELSITKSKFHTSGWTHSRKKVVADTLGFSENSLAFYLGVPIFVDKPPRIHFPGLADRIKENLLAWKGSLLSYTGMISLSSVIDNFLHYFSLLVAQGIEYNHGIQDQKLYVNFAMLTMLSW